MKFNEESFKKAITDCKMIHWENHFKKVVMSYLNHESMKHEKGDLLIGVCTKSYFHEEDLEQLDREQIEIEDVRKFVKGQEYEVVFGLFDPNYFKLKE